MADHLSLMTAKNKANTAVMTGSDNETVPASGGEP